MRLQVDSSLPLGSSIIHPQGSPFVPYRKTYTEESLKTLVFMIYSPQTLLQNPYLHLKIYSPFVALIDPDILIILMETCLMGEGMRIFTFSTNIEKGEYFHPLLMISQYNDYSFNKLVRKLILTFH